MSVVFSGRVKRDEEGLNLRQTCDMAYDKLATPLATEAT